jgi:hypothetical protein
VAIANGALWNNFYNNGPLWTVPASTGSYTGQFILYGTNVTIGPRVLKVYVLPATVTKPYAAPPTVDPTAFNYYVQHARTATLPNSTFPIYATSTVNVTLVGGSQTVNLTLPHYTP